MFSGVALDPLITYSQFEQKETPYLKKDKLGNIVEKKSKKTESITVFPLIGQWKN